MKALSLLKVLYIILGRMYEFYDNILVPFSA